VHSFILQLLFWALFVGAAEETGYQNLSYRWEVRVKRESLDPSPLTTVQGRGGYSAKSYLESASHFNSAFCFFLPVACYNCSDGNFFRARTYQPFSNGPSRMLRAFHAIAT